MKVCLGPMHIASGLFMLRQGCELTALMPMFVSSSLTSSDLLRQTITQRKILSCLMDYDVFHGMFGVNFVHNYKEMARRKKFFATFNGVIYGVGLPRERTWRLVCNHCQALKACGTTTSSTTQGSY